MLLDRYTKTLFAVFTLVAATFLVVNHIIAEAPIQDWLLAGILFLISLSFWAWLWQESLPKTTALAVRESTHLPVKAQEWIIERQDAGQAGADASILAPHDRAMVEAGVITLEEGGPVFLDTLEVNRFRSTDEILSAVGPGQLMEAMVSNAMPDSGDFEEAVADDRIEGSATRSDEEADDDDETSLHDRLEGSATRSDEEADDDHDDTDADGSAAGDVPAQPAAGIDDFTRIEGIGPKYSQALVAAGITTFAQLAAASLDTLEQAVSGTALRRPSSLDTWSEQAEYLVRGDAAGLESFQARLKGGRRTDENQN